jgi:hypothetical protein
VPGDERLELRHERRVATELEVGLDSLLQGGELELVEPSDLGASKGVVGEVHERGAAPESERPPELLRRALRLSPGKTAAGVVDQALEAVRVELARIDPQEVAGAVGLEPAARCS